MSTEDKIQAVRDHWIGAVKEVRNAVTQHPAKFRELSKLLDKEWERRMVATINHFSSDNQEFGNDRGWHLIVALSERISHPPFYIGLEVIERRLQHITDAARSQNKLKSLQSTCRELISRQANQVHAAIFELSILYTLSNIDPDANLFPKVGSDGQDVEAVISIDQRNIYCECTIRGYSSHDDIQGVVNPHFVPRLMVENTLGIKCGPDGQLAQVSLENPTVLFTCIGFDGMNPYYDLEMKERLIQTSCSLVVVFTRYHCGAFKTFENPNSPNPLTGREVEAIEKGLEAHLKCTNLNSAV